MARPLTRVPTQKPHRSGASSAPMVHTSGTTIASTGWRDRFHRNSVATGRARSSTGTFRCGSTNNRYRSKASCSAAPSILPYLVLGVAAAAAAALAMHRVRCVAAALLALVSIVAFAVSLVEQSSIPSAAGRRVSFFVIPALAAMCGLVALVRPRSVYTFVLKVASALIIPLWVFLNAKTLTNARLPGDVAPIVMRCCVVAAAATVVAFVVIDLPRELRAAGQRNAALMRRELVEDRSSRGAAAEPH